MWSRPDREIQQRMVACDVLDLLAGGIAVYLSDTHGQPKTDSDARDLLNERKICILAALRAVQDPGVRRFLENGLIEQLLSRQTAIVFRSGKFAKVPLPIRSTDGAS